MSAPQSVQYFATGVITLHVGHAIMGSADSCVGPAGTAGTAIVESVCDTIDAGFTGITVGVIAGRSTVPDFALTAGALDCGVAGGEDGDAGEAGGASEGFGTPET